MPENLDLQYDQMVRFIKGYETYVNRIGMRAILSSFLSVKGFWGSFRNTSKIYNQDPLSGKTNEVMKTLFLTSATEAERMIPYYSVVTSDYPLDALSNLLRSEFADVDFDKLIKIHELRKAKLSSVSMSYVTGLVLGGATLVLKSIPKKVVEQYIGLSFDDFEVQVFFVMLGLLAYGMVVVLPAWIMVLRARYVHSLVSSILEYTAIKFD